MRNYALSLAITTAAALTSLSQSALAQPDADAEPAAPAEVEMAAEASEGAETTATPRAPRPALPTICLAGDHSGVKDESARTAFGVVCDSLRRAGAPVNGVSETPGDATAAYRIELQRLDQVVILRITYEEPIGYARDSRTVSLNGIDEVLVGADRVTTALVQGKSLEETATVNTLVGTETRDYKKKAGETYWGLGLMGQAIPAAGVYAGAGLEVPVFYETPQLAFGGSLRVSVTGGSETSKNRATYGSFAFGARGFLGGGDISPYLGGGLGFGWMDLQQQKGSSHFRGEGEGFGAYVEGGVEMLRLHKTRFLISLRADVPFFATTQTSDPVFDSTTRTYSSPEERQQYAIPLSLNVTFMPFKL